MSVAIGAVTAAVVEANKKKSTAADTFNKATRKPVKTPKKKLWKRVCPGAPR